ncbi:hypothetical protein ACH4RG_22975 [Streptomyces sp. NPDC021019]|uniref:hypothetical protein n=1 Tax=Streptomyces sp. NPDC021019 TaxID=3365108 RepID=UPI0037A2846E
MKKSFALNVEPHEAAIGEHTLLFQPEVMGDQFLDAYERLRTTQRAAGVDGDLTAAEPAVLRQVVDELRVFLANLMLPESAKVFAQWEVRAGGETLGSYGSPAEAADAAESAGDGAAVVSVSLPLPDRIMVELLEFAVELYGGGAKRPPTSSGGSAQASRSPGNPGRAGSRSRG